MGFNLERLFCSSQAETNSIGFPNLFTSGKRCVAIAFDKPRRTKQFFYSPPYPRDKTALNNSPPPGTKGWTCPGGCPGGMVTDGIEPRI